MKKFLLFLLLLVGAVSPTLATDVFLTGGINSWSFEDSWKFTDLGDSKFILLNKTIDGTQDIKVGQNSSWTGYNLGWGTTCSLGQNKIYNNGGNGNAPSNFTGDLYLDLSTAYNNNNYYYSYFIPQFYIRGIGDWDVSDSWKFVFDTSKKKYVLSNVTIPASTGFKIADASYSHINYGGCTNMNVNTEYTGVSGSGINLTLSSDFTGDVEFDYFTHKFTFIPAVTKVETPTFSSNADTKGTFTISCATDGATIEYSLDGGTNWTPYDDPVPAPETAFTVQAKASKNGLTASDVATKNYYQLYTVYWDNTGKNYATPKTYIWTSSSTKLTTNSYPGDEMTLVSGSLYKYQFRSNSTPYKLLFACDGDSDKTSDFEFVNGATYNEKGKASSVATPVISDETDFCSQITLSCSTNDATIYYTFGDGDYPAGTWKEYTTAINTPATAYTIRAIAVKGAEQSEVASRSFAPRFTVYFDDTNSNWGTVFAYLWNGSTELTGDFPGTAMTSLGDNLYRFTFRSGTAPSQVIFAIAKDSSKTSDLDFVNGATYTAAGVIKDLWLLGTMNDWTPSNDWKFTSTNGVDYTLNNVAISNISWFKIANVTYNSSTNKYDWDGTDNYGNDSNVEGDAMDYNAGPYTLGQGSSATNCSLTANFTGNITFNRSTRKLSFNYVDPGATATISIRHIPSIAKDIDGIEDGTKISKIMFRIEDNFKSVNTNDVSVVVKRDLFKDFSGNANSEIVPVTLGGVTVAPLGVTTTSTSSTNDKGQTVYKNVHTGYFLITNFDWQDGEVNQDADHNFYINAEITGTNTSLEVKTVNAFAVGGNVVPFDYLTGTVGNYTYGDTYVISDNPIDIEIVNSFTPEGITYQRTMKATTKPDTYSWQPWFMPFDVTFAEAADFVATNANYGNLEILSFEGVTTEGDTKIANFTVETGSGTDIAMHANTPYIFLPKKTGFQELEFTGRLINATSEETFKGDSNWRMYGNYTGVAMGPNGEQNSYALSNGTFSKAGSTDTTLPPFRVRIKSNAASAPGKLRIARVENATSAEEEMVNDLFEGMMSGDAVIYDMQGRRVTNPGRGMYIINGHKVVIR